MMKDETIQRLLSYTAKYQKKFPEYTYGGDIFSKDIFQNNSDIFINIHTKVANTLNKSLHGHDFFEINYVLKGHCLQNINNNSEIEMKEGTICILNPNVRHNLQVFHENDMVINIALKKALFTSSFWNLLEQSENIGQFFLNYFLALDTSSDFLLFTLEKDMRIEVLLDYMCQEYLDSFPYNQLALRCELILFFTEILRKQNHQISNTYFTDKVSVQITALYQYLSQNYATATLESTAAYFHYHPKYLSNFVKKHTGKNFSAILNDIKMSQANYYLLNTNMPIQEISEKLGFSQLCNFYAFIKKRCGTTPLKYRQKNSSM